MHYFIYPKKDATIYSKYPSKNTGMDHIIELDQIQGTGTRTIFPSNIFAGSDGNGVFSSQDAGVNWANLTSAMRFDTVNSLASSGSYLFAGTSGSGVYVSTDLGTSWNQSNFGLANLDVKELVMSGSTLFAGTAFGIFRSDDNANSWTDISNGISPLLINAVEIHNSKLYVGTFGTFNFYTSSDGGNSWFSSSVGLSGKFINVIRDAGSNLVAGTFSGIFLSQNDGYSWVPMSGNLSPSIDIAVAFVSGNRIYAGSDGSGLFYTTNTGSSWTLTNNGLTSTFIDSAMVSASYIFIGTDSGSFYSNNNSVSWTKIGASLINDNIHCFTFSNEPVVETLNDNSRILLQFDITQLSQSISKGTVSSRFKCYLNMYTAKAYNIPVDYTINVHPLLQSWTMGTGIFYESPETIDGASWNNRAASFLWNSAGGDYAAFYLASEEFSYDSNDPKIDVTDLMKLWLSGSIANNGFIVKRPDSQEFGQTNFGRLAFYSIDTNTVYLPSLEVVWDDSRYITGSTTYVMSGSYTGTFSGSANTLVSGNANFIYTGSNSTTAYVGVLSGSFYGPIIGAFIGIVSGNFTGSATGAYSGSVNQDLSGLFTGSLAGYFIGALTGSFTGNLSGSYTGSLYGTGSGQLTASVVGTYIGTETGSLTGQFSPILSGSSFEPIASEQISIVMKNLKPQYKYQTRARIRFAGKDLNQRKTFAIVPLSNFSIIKYLPVGTKYSILDAYSGRVLIPFDSYTNISCDLEGNYFDLDLSGFMPERSYKIQFLVPINGIDVLIDKNYVFKVVK